MQQKKKTKRVRERKEAGKEVRRDSLHLESLRLSLFINSVPLPLPAQTWQAVVTKKRAMQTLHRLLCHLQTD